MTPIDVLVLVDHRDGAAEPVAFQLLAQARALAGSGPVGALVLAADARPIADALRCAGADVIHVVEHPGLESYNPEAFAKATAEAVRRLEPRLFLCAHTFTGMEIAPWVAARLGLPLVSNCLSLAVDGPDLVADRPTHGLAWQTRLRLPLQGTIVASLARGGGARQRLKGPAAVVQALDLDVTALRVRTRVRETVRPEAGAVDISRAEVVVGIGRGVRDPANVAVMEELARALGGVLACSRPLVDLDWMPQERQVGVSGKEIHAKVYLACGISGAAQHVAGIADAQTIIAVNQDARAPIFRVAHYGVVADLFEVVPALIEEAKRRRTD